MHHPKTSIYYQVTQHHQKQIKRASLLKELVDTHQELLLPSEPCQEKTKLQQHEQLHKRALEQLLEQIEDKQCGIHPLGQV